MHRWLNIVVDGTTELGPYWRKILSDCIQKIVRCFCNNSQEQGDRSATCKLGLVMYNSNSDLGGFNLRCVNWTKDVDTFLRTLSCINFNGDEISQFAMAEGLAEALMMYTKPFMGRSTIEDYYNGERHCILVSAGDPIPLKMSVTVPMVQDGKLVLGRLQPNLEASFLDVTQMFNPLAVSLSVITPKQNAIFGELFNLGNNITDTANTPLPSYKVDQFVVMLSRNFKEGREAMHGKRVKDVSSEPSKKSIAYANATTTDITLTEHHDGGNLQGLDIIPNSSDKAENNNVSSSGSFSPAKLFEDIMADLGSNAVLQSANPWTSSLTLAEDPLHGLFSPAQSTFDLGDLGNLFAWGQGQTNNTTMKEVSKDALNETNQAEIGKTLEGPRNEAQSISTTNQNSDIVDLTKEHNNEVQIPPLVFPNVPPSTTTPKEIGSSTSSKGVLPLPRGSTNAVILDFSSGKSYSSTASSMLPPQRSSRSYIFSGQNTSNLWPSSQQLPSLSVQHHNVITSSGSTNVGGVSRGPFSSGHQQHQRRHHRNFSSYGPLHRSRRIGARTNYYPPVPRTAQLTPSKPLLPISPSAVDFGGSIQTWEGYICGKVWQGNMFFNKAKCYRRAASPSQLTVNWSSRLDVTNYIPPKAINCTQSLYHYNVEYVLFEIKEYTNRDLFNHLSKNDMCAKVDMPSYTVILSPTQTEFFYVGIVFPRVTVFVDQLEP